MTDYEKVMTGLNCMTRCEAVLKQECQERQCPYRDTDCDIAVMVDALNLLEAYKEAIERLRDAVQEMREDGDLDLRTVLEYIDALKTEVENGDG